MDLVCEAWWILGVMTAFGVGVIMALIVWTLPMPRQGRQSSGDQEEKDGSGGCFVA